jgi:hypothetical protein
VYTYNKNRHKSSRLSECENRSLLRNDCRAEENRDLTRWSALPACQTSEIAKYESGMSLVLLFVIAQEKVKFR